MARISRAQRDAIFGQPGDVQRVAVLTPWGLWVQCHVLVRDVFLAACNDAFRQPWKPKRIDSYNYRPIRGSSSPSLHGYALAFDFFATPPNVVPPGGVWTPDNGVPATFAKCFTDRGFFWGANFSRVDVPHIEWAQGKPANTATNTQPAPASPEDDLTDAERKTLNEINRKLDAVRAGIIGGEGFTDLKWLDDRLKKTAADIIAALKK